MSQPVDVEFMAGYKTIGDTSSGTAKALIRIGGAAGVMEVPAWADTLLGIYTHASSSLPTTLEDCVCWGYLESDDGMSIKPFEFFYPPISAVLGATASTNSTPGEYWAVNAPVRPLSKIITYGQWLSGAAATTAATYMAVTFWFSNSRASGVWAPTSLDPRPGIQRYRKVGNHTPLQSAASGYDSEATYQINLGQGGGVITELGGLHHDFTPVTSAVGGGVFRFNSNDVPLFPQEFYSNAYGALLGAAGSFDYAHILTRRPCHCEADSVVTFANQYLQGLAQTLTTGDYITFVEFIRM